MVNQGDPEPHVSGGDHVGVKVLGKHVLPCQVSCHVLGVGIGILAIRVSLNSLD